jgi:Ca-activated chloride channel family protein
VNIQFQYKEFSWLFFAILFFLLLFILLLNWKKRIIKRIGDEKLVKALITGYSQKLFASKFIFLSIAFTFGIVAVMNPRQAGSSENFSRKGIDVMIALDVSKSMLATDVQPSRLEKAKAFINEVLDKMPDNQAGLVLFAGKAYLQMPLTIDHDAVKSFVGEANPNTVTVQGTVINEALTMSANAFVSAEKFKTIILISDGEDHDENAIKTAEQLAQEGVMINTIGIGSPEGATLIDSTTGEPKKDETGNVVVSKLNEQELQQLAEKTNGVYSRLQNENDATKILIDHLSQIEKKALVDTAFINYKTFYIWAAVAMFVFLFIENFIPEKKKAK